MLEKQQSQFMELIVPQDYDILSSWVNELNGNDSEMEKMTMGLKRNNDLIIGYMVVDQGQKDSCLGDGIVRNGKDEKPWIASNGLFGEGMYFYEYNYKYAEHMAKSCKADLVGAIIHLDNVLDFTDGTLINLLNFPSRYFQINLE